MPISKIKCGEFCPYNKKLFCPFYYEVEFPKKAEQKKDEIPRKIKTKKSSIKPSKMKKMKRKTHNGEDDQKKETVWMSFFGTIAVNDFFTSNFIGRMTDLNLGEFTCDSIGAEEDNYESLKLEGKIQTLDKECDFGGDIIIDVVVNYKDGSSKEYNLEGKFSTFYKSGGTTTPEEDSEETEINTGSEIEYDKEEQVSMKFYEGELKLNGFNGTINFYTDM